MRAFRIALAYPQQVNRLTLATNVVQAATDTRQAWVMPGMTMLFQVKDPTMLEIVKPGDKVVFQGREGQRCIRRY